MTNEMEREAVYNTIIAVLEQGGVSITPAESEIIRRLVRKLCRDVHSGSGVLFTERLGAVLRNFELFAEALETQSRQGVPEFLRSFDPQRLRELAGILGANLGAFTSFDRPGFTKQV